jgi:ribosomal protein S18 acetylase RimI-like enzyme
MELPHPVRVFCRAAAELGEHSARTRWGVVMSDSRYPLIWDANNAAVLEPASNLTAEEIREVLLPELRAAGAPVEHVEFWDPSGSQALEELRRAQDPAWRAHRPHTDAVMVFRPGAGAATGAARPGVGVEESLELDEDFWAWYRTSLPEFGDELSADVLDQMVARIRTLFVPAGLRFFVGWHDGQRAGYTSLLSLEGVGYLDGVVTMPGFRRRGVASATVLAAVEASRAAGDRFLFLLTETEGDARRLYERLGFRVASEVESFTRPLVSQEVSSE